MLCIIWLEGIWICCHAFDFSPLINTTSNAFTSRKELFIILPHTDDKNLALMSLLLKDHRNASEVKMKNNDNISLCFHFAIHKQATKILWWKMIKVTSKLCKIVWNAHHKRQNHKNHNINYKMKTLRNATWNFFPPTVCCSGERRIPEVFHLFIAAENCFAFVIEIFLRNFNFQWH